MIRYEDIIRKIHLLENQKIKNEERIKKYSEENILIANKLKLLNQKKEMMEKMESDLSDALFISCFLNGLDRKSQAGCVSLE